MPVGDDYWYQTYGIPKPDNYDELKRQEEERRAAMVRQEPPSPEPDKKQKGKSSLADFEKRRFYHRMLESLADFFDHARH